MNKTAVVLALAMTVSSSLYAQQFLPTKSIVNARDLGGYITEDGRKVKDHVLIRAPGPITSSFPSTPAATPRSR